MLKAIPAAILATPVVTIGAGVKFDSPALMVDDAHQTEVRPCS
ncbi:MAG TPA: hypothetical protein VGN64_23580 [Dyadobacter sp.]|nr:hypothetical protein [Dyadobacter sp.]